MLTLYDWLLGIAEIAAVFLSIVAGVMAVSLFKISHKESILNAWKFLIIALVLFALEEIFGALKSFGIYSTPHLTHIIPSFIMAFLIAALIAQINVNKGWVK
jgi:hypothetical protein